MIRRLTSACVASHQECAQGHGHGLAGSTLIEILIALGIIAIALTVFVSTLQLGVRSIAGVQEQTIATALARTQMEAVKSASWPGPYPSVSTPEGYAIAVSTASGPLATLQLITVRVQHDGREILSVDGYKGQR